MVQHIEACQQADDSRDRGSGEGSAQGLSAGVAQVLAKLLTAQAAANASRAAPLKALLRSLENNAALFVQQVRTVVAGLAHSLPPHQAARVLTVDRITTSLKRNGCRRRICPLKCSAGASLLLEQRRQQLSNHSQVPRQAAAMGLP
jgi:hypothetical protein